MNSKIENLFGLAEKKASPAEEQKPPGEIDALLADRDSEMQGLIKAAGLILAERPDLEGDLQNWFTRGSWAGVSPSELRRELLAISQKPPRAESKPWRGPDKGYYGFRPPS